MKTVNVIYATGALKKFLDARAQGASRELLMQLSADSLLELEAERWAAPLKGVGAVVLQFDPARTRAAERE